MANVTIKRISELGSKWVLAPERYDLRRNALDAPDGPTTTTFLGEIVEVVRQTLNPTSKTAIGRTFVVLDTSDIREGLIVGRKDTVSGPEIGSTKKIFMRKDILISRLRPYLRQVAIVDKGFSESTGDAELACSTEFYVLRSKSQSEIDFLVPYLLSAPVQKVLAASQEGGHHPRFDESVLLALPVPLKLLKRRDEYSNAISRAAISYRESESLIQSHIVRVDEYMSVG
jgi:hypothetical protein